jgi:hypothetical protein
VMNPLIRSEAADQGAPADVDADNSRTEATR